MSCKSQASTTLGSAQSICLIRHFVEMFTCTQVSPGRTCIAGARGEVKSAHLRGSNHCESFELSIDPEKIRSVVE